MDRVEKDYHHSTEIRKSYEILPLQGVWSWLTGNKYWVANRFGKVIPQS